MVNSFDMDRDRVGDQPGAAAGTSQAAMAVGRKIWSAPCSRVVRAPGARPSPGAARGGGVAPRTNNALNESIKAVADQFADLTMRTAGTIKMAKGPTLSPFVRAPTRS
jgi:hypothetical protein